uniref:Uncharacterized protein n=1 Tax=Arundo donax TaxID=35708 RepID=A0A0A9GIA6_ARUDO
MSYRGDLFLVSPRSS